MRQILKPLPIVGRKLPYGQILGRIYQEGTMTKLRIKTSSGIKWVELEGV